MRLDVIRALEALGSVGVGCGSEAVDSSADAPLLTPASAAAAADGGAAPVRGAAALDDVDACDGCSCGAAAALILERRATFKPSWTVEKSLALNTIEWKTRDWKSAPRTAFISSSSSLSASSIACCSEFPDAARLSPTDAFATTEA